MRKPRVLKNGALYHVTARANRKEMIFDSGKVRELFLEVVNRAKRRYCFRIENFCVMGNHYHLMIRPGPNESLSRIMQWIMSVFAMAFNRKHGLTGHVWGCRFFSRILDNFNECLKVFEYIDKNPIEAHLVSFEREWRYGGLFHDCTGCREIMDGISEYFLLLFPAHALLRLPEWQDC